MPVPLPILYALASRRTQPQTRPVAQGIGQDMTLMDRLQLLNLLHRLGLWPTQEVPNHGGSFVLPAPDMPDLGMPRPDPEQTEPGEPFRGFYGPSPAEAPHPLLGPWRGLRPIPAVPYPVGPLPSGTT